MGKINLAFNTGANTNRDDGMCWNKIKTLWHKIRDILLYILIILLSLVSVGFVVSDFVFNLTTAIATIVLAFLAYFQLRESKKARSAQVLLEIYEIMQIVRECKLKLQSIECSICQDNPELGSDKPKLWEKILSTKEGYDLTNKMLNDLNRVVLLCNEDLVDSRYVMKAYPEVLEDAWYFFMNVKVIEKARKELGNDYLKELEMFVMKHKEYRNGHKIPRNNCDEGDEMKPHYNFMAGICFATGLALLLLFFPPLAQSIFGEWKLWELLVGTVSSICFLIASVYIYYKS